jgi:hypothetical protein
MIPSAHSDPALSGCWPVACLLMATLPAWALQVMPVRDGETAVRPHCGRRPDPHRPLGGPHPVLAYPQGAAGHRQEHPHRPDLRAAPGPGRAGVPVPDRRDGRHLRPHPAAGGHARREPDPEGPGAARGATFQSRANRLAASRWSRNWPCCWPPTGCRRHGSARARRDAAPVARLPLRAGCAPGWGRRWWRTCSSSPTPARPKCAWLSRSSIGPAFSAVAVENQALNPGEATRIFVIRQREGDE